MKRYILLLVLAVIFCSARGNVAAPRAFISEIFFDGTGNWTLELGFYPYGASEIDSIRIESSAGSSKVSFFSLIKGGGYPNFDSLAVITNANLVTPVSVNPLSDYIKVISYVWGFPQPDYVAFGNYPGSAVDCKQNAESISYLTFAQGFALCRSFCIDKSPTIGTGNDTTGALSTYTGKVYDPSGNVFMQGFFELPPGLNITLTINPDGSFTQRVFARRYAFDTIRIYFPPWPYTVKTYTVAHVDFCLRPDTLHLQDIITTSLVTALEKHDADDNNLVVISPNPFTRKVTFFFNAGNRDPADELSLSIFSQEGRRLKQVSLPADQKKYEWIPDEFIPSGVLIFQLKKDGQVLTTGKLLKL